MTTSDPKQLLNFMKKIAFSALAIICLGACESESDSESSISEPDARFVTAVSEEVIVDSEPNLDENLDKAFEIVRAVCEGGFYSRSCASPGIVPPMNIDSDNLVPVELIVNHAAHVEPNYIFIRCDSEVSPPPTELVEECHRLVVAYASNGQ